MKIKTFLKFLFNLLVLIINLNVNCYNYDLEYKI